MKIGAIPPLIYPVATRNRFTPASTSERPITGIPTAIFISGIVPAVFRNPGFAPYATESPKMKSPFASQLKKNVVPRAIATNAVTMNRRRPSASV